MLFTYAYLSLLGACIGSFLGVVIHRLPRGEGLVTPRSRCPGCGAVLRWWHLAPVAGYLALRGRCAVCRTRIAPSYVLVELGTAAVALGLWQDYGWSVLLPRYGVLAAFLIAAGEIDRRHGMIPNRLVAAGSMAGLGLALAVGAWSTAVVAAVASGGLMGGVRLGSRLAFGRPGMGMGDVKLAAMMGLYLDWSVLWVLYLAMVVGGVFGLIGILTGRLSRRARLPFAPFMAVGTALYLFGLRPDLVMPL